MLKLIFTVISTVALLVLPTSAEASLTFAFNPTPVVSQFSDSGTFDVTVTNTMQNSVTLAHSEINGGTEVVSFDNSVVTISGSIAAIPIGSPISIGAGETQVLGSLSFTTIATTIDSTTISGGFGIVIDSTDIDTANLTSTFLAVPEPATIITFAGAVAGLAMRRRRS